ncbi:hypothetical protein [Serratia sp. Se-RSBMAAmG]|uniref:hypothetical protein n=1 Tax=Serratia sp. Se-RSBMAAmG TaxID=3043305 RepID=UPI0024AFDFFD|nr:hypothetical protein [Serratia sp. Se-RSBMAAmG]MDI6976260.1 hypothetical protein [Serratia sp. Se-RSBMAAmG]
MIEVRLKDHSQAFSFASANNCGEKGALFAVYDQHKPVSKFPIESIFDVTQHLEMKEKPEKHMTVSVLLKGSVAPITNSSAFKTESTDKFFVIYIDAENKVIVKRYPLSNIVLIQEDYNSK